MHLDLIEGKLGDLETSTNIANQKLSELKSAVNVSGQATNTLAQISSLGCEFTVNLQAVQSGLFPDQTKLKSPHLFQV